MKKLILILLTTASFAQTQINVIVDPYATYKDGFINIGAEIETISKSLYIKAGATAFTALEPLYLDFYGGIGYTKQVGKFDKLRLFTGAKAGVIYRETAPSLYPIVGGEIGLSQQITERLIIGCKMSHDYRGDTEFWGEHLKIRWISSGFVFVSFRL